VVKVLPAESPAVETPVSDSLLRPEGPIALEALGVNMFYGSFHALKEVSAAFPARQVTALIGPSGCG
jgi:phosphate transport system ATP-binding protein